MSNSSWHLARCICLLCALIISSLSPSNGQDSTASRDFSETWSVHFQFTAIGQYHGAFPASYSGLNSLSNTEESPLSVTATLYLGRTLWKGGEIYANPEISGGEGFSSTKGIAGFPNGEVYRVGDPKPKTTVARAFLRQHVSLGGSDTERVSPEENQLAGVLPASRLTLTAGRFGLTDIFENIAYATEPRTQFMNWSIWGAGAWDYAADTRGYTWGLAAEFHLPAWMVNLAAVMVPTEANGPDFDTNLREAYSFNLELVKPYHLAGKDGKVRLLGFWNHAHMGNYSQAISMARATGKPPDITLTRSYSLKSGFVFAVEQAFGKAIGGFARYSWNNGTTESWVFTEIDRSIELGVNIGGSIWHRPDDNVGVAFVANALSDDHQEYLALGGYGFIIGDGKLNYGPEQILEIYYSLRITQTFWLSLDNQLIINPAYNRDRGPVVDAVAIRGHVEF